MTYVTEVIDKTNMLLAGITALLAYVLGEHWILFFAYLCLNIGDFITRWMAAYITGTEESGKCLVGLVKKFGYWVMIMVSFGMSAIFVHIGNVIGIDLGITDLIGWFVLCTLIINEARSILENFVDAGYNPPKILIKGLKVAEELIEEVSGEDDEE